MPIYDLSCARCGRTEEVILLAGEAEPAACPACGGELRRQMSRFAVVSHGGGAPAAARPVRTSCGHIGGCRCSVKLDRPNPFADRLVPAESGGHSHAHASSPASDVQESVPRRGGRAAR